MHNTALQWDAPPASRLRPPELQRYSDAACPNNVVRGVDFGERRAAPYNPSLERTRFHCYALLGIAILRMAQPRQGVAHLALR